ncbi:MAG: hypothetical protein KGJ56_00450 [Gammaproteobacteria bacterium]|nr:hypothetical protein [Gammaproteobacteria bacterium]
MSYQHETRFEDHFPISVMISHHAGLEHINREIFTVIRQLQAQFQEDTRENEALSGTTTTYGGYQTSRKMMFLNREEPAIRTLRDQVILPGIGRYLQQSYDDKLRNSGTRTVSWANILSEGDWQAPHMHPSVGNLASGVYYVETPDKPTPQGCIEFLNPHPVAHHHGISLTRRLHPKAGDLIIFPPYYIHYVYPFRGAGERAIVAFDVILQTTQFIF